VIDIVTVIHNDKNKQQAEELRSAFALHETDFTFYVHSNEVNNIGFGKACNAGAFRKGVNGEYIGFLNPDLVLHGPILSLVREIFNKEPNTVIVGERFNKPKRELKIWGVVDWVCGAAFFVRRDWFTEVGGFDEKYVWSWEETDLIRLAQSQGRRVHSISLPVSHSSPSDDTAIDSAYKAKHFQEGQQRFVKKWRK
jgi:GT2 family glycosyltransferase